MVRFIESIKFNSAFAKAIYDAFYDPEKEELDFYGKRFKYKKKWEGWPDGLDMENFEIDSLGSEHIVFVSGGDWQEMVPVALRLYKGKLIWCPFESYTKKSNVEIKCACKDLISCAKGQIAEDCQTAGPAMGDVLQNVGSVLSLGYKNGRVLPLPKKRANSKDYNTIPKF
jgi:hypothetical protein